MPVKGKAGIPPVVGQQQKRRQNHGVLLGGNRSPEEYQHSRGNAPGNYRFAAVKENRERCEDEKNAELFRPSRKVRHRFGLRRMEKEKRSREGREKRAARLLRSLPLQKTADDQKNQAAGDAVQQHIHYMVGVRIVAADLRVHPVCEHQDRTQPAQPYTQGLGESRKGKRQRDIVEKERTVQSGPVGPECSDDRACRRGEPHPALLRPRATAPFPVLRISRFLVFMAAQTV